MNSNFFVSQFSLGKLCVLSVFLFCFFFSFLVCFEMVTA
jgi:hypothetical protein